MANEDYFVGINNQLDIRRNVLESSKEMIKTLQSYERLQAIREKKLKRMQQLRTVTKELELLFSKLRGQLPKTKLRAAAKPRIRIKLNEPYEGLSELEKLEAKLREVEREIQGIG